MLIRAIFWFSLVVMLVPVNVDQRYPGSQSFAGYQAIMLAKSVIGDVSGFCSRNPGSCESTKNIMDGFSARVRAHAFQISNMIRSKNTPYPTDTVITGSISLKK